MMGLVIKVIKKNAPHVERAELDNVSLLSRTVDVDLCYQCNRNRRKGNIQTYKIKTTYFTTNFTNHTFLEQETHNESIRRISIKVS